MQVLNNTPLAPYTSLGAGGPAEKLLIVANAQELEHALHELADGEPCWLLGYGTNSLISDQGLPGTVILTHGGTITHEDSTLVADSGAWWDDLVQESIKVGSWGLELMSGIPGGVGAAVIGNIAAYGQAVSDSLAWIEVYDRHTKSTRRMKADELTFDYRQSSLQAEDAKSLVILRVAFSESAKPTHQLTYRSALDEADKLHLEPDTLANRRKIIMAARSTAQSLYNPDEDKQQKTAGSFFKNPKVAPELAEHIMSYDETGRSLEQLKAQNLVHGGDAVRISASHVLLAAGFHRGQSWGQVQLNDKHILKIQNNGQATAQDIYDAAQLIVREVKAKLGIDLEVEVRSLGEFNHG